MRLRMTSVEIACFYFISGILINAFQMSRMYPQRTIASVRPLLRGPRICVSTKCDQYAMEIASRHKHPTFLRGVIQSSVIKFVGLLGWFVVCIRNRLRVTRHNILLKEVLSRPSGRGLLTVANHQSVVDDPGLWGALLPFWSLAPAQLRWVLCTEDVFFAKPFLTALFAAGNVLPLDRTGSMEQPMFRIFQEKLASGAWCHIFPEGRVWQNWRFLDRAGKALDEPVLGEFKLGVGKLVAHSWPNVPLVLPMYHKGMSGVIPEKVIPSQQLPAETDSSTMHNLSKKRRKHCPSVPQSLFPRGGNTIHCYIGEPLDFTAEVAAFERSHPGELAHWNTTLNKLVLYERITMQIRAAVLKLEAEAYNRTLPINPIPIDTHPESAVLRSYSEDSAIHVGSIEEEQSVLQ